MRKSILLFLLFVTFSCTKDELIIKDIQQPTITISVRSVTPYSAMFIAEITSTTGTNRAIIRGFVMSSTGTPNLNDDNTTVLWSPNGSGSYGYVPILKPNTDYTVAAFTYYWGYANRVVYSDPIKIHTPN